MLTLVRLLVGKIIFAKVTKVGIINKKVTKVGIDMGIEIRELRDRTNLSQREFANQYGIPISTLRKWEQGEASPSSYVVRMLARVIKGNNNQVEEIKCKDGKKYYYDSIANTISDSLGNTIAITEDLEGVKRENLPIYVQDLFESFYSIQNKFNQDIKFDKKEDIIWS